jgi:hypothetical protein
MITSMIIRITATSIKSQGVPRTCTALPKHSFPLGMPIAGSAHLPAHTPRPTPGAPPSAVAANPINSPSLPSLPSRVKTLPPPWECRSPDRHTTPPPPYPNPLRWRGARRRGGSVKHPLHPIHLGFCRGLYSSGIELVSPFEMGGDMSLNSFSTAISPVGRNVRILTMLGKKSDSDGVQSSY